MRTFLALLAALAFGLASEPPHYVLNDAHLHLTNDVEEGPDIHDFLATMGDKVGRAALFGHLQGDAPLYYYSFADADIAMAYRSLAPEDQARLDPMISGFNPADAYAVDHIRRVLTTFPGVFSGIGEFAIARGTLTEPALDRILDFAAEAGLVVLMHSDADVPLRLAQLRDLFRRHPATTIVWAPARPQRAAHPAATQAQPLDDLLSNAALRRLFIDLSSMQGAASVVADPHTTTVIASLINRHPDRFLFGTDDVAPAGQAGYLATYDSCAPLLAELTPAAKEQFLRTNYERLFDEARVRVRAWEQNHTKEKS